MTLNNEIKFKKATLAEAEKIMEIIEYAKIIQRKQNNFQWDDKYPLIEHINDDINNNRGYILVEDDQILGYIALVLIKDDFFSLLKKEDVYYASTNRIVVDLRLNRKGLGRLILKNAIDEAISLNAGYLKGSTNVNNPGMISLFSKYGFRKTGYFRSMVNDEELNFYWFEKDIRMYK